MAARPKQNKFTLVHAVYIKIIPDSPRERRGWLAGLAVSMEQSETSNPCLDTRLTMPVTWKYFTDRPRVFKKNPDVFKNIT